MFTGERIAELARNCAEQELSVRDIRILALQLPLIVSSLFMLELKIKHGIQIYV